MSSSQNLRCEAILVKYKILSLFQKIHCNLSWLLKGLSLCRSCRKSLKVVGAFQADAVLCVQRIMGRTKGGREEQALVSVLSERGLGYQSSYHIRFP